MSRIRIHKEGYRIIIVNALLWLAIAALFFVFCSNLTVNIIVAVVCLGFAIFMLRFFRVPRRDPMRGDHLVIAPGDGHVVDIREVEEDESFRSGVKAHSGHKHFQDPRHRQGCFHIA